MFSIPGKRRFESDDKFFEEGNIICRFYREAQHCSLELEVENDMTMEENIQSIYCQIQGCYREFKTISRFEDHYASQHKNVCTTCGRCFPTNNLLDIHINEQHNPMFDSLAAKKPMYQCLVLGCLQMFKGSKLRRKHLIEFHKYPSSFRFDRRKTKSKTSVPIEPMEAVTSETVIQKLNLNRDFITRISKRLHEVPNTEFSFGHGVQKTFLKRRRKQRGNHLTGPATTGSAVGSIDVKDLNDALNCS